MQDLTDPLNIPFRKVDRVRDVSRIIDEAGDAGRAGDRANDARKKFDEGNLVGDAFKYGRTPKGRPLTKHYGTETGPERNIPGSVVDQTIDSFPGKPVGGGKIVHYDPDNNVTVVIGDNESIVSARKGRPPKHQH